jgi:3-dehydroquinate dehydratase type I
MSLICVPIAVEAAGEIPLALERAARARVLGARMVEWRCDGLASDDDAAGAIARLVREAALPSIVTIRSAEEGGTCALAENARLALLAKVARAEHAPKMIDVEFAAMAPDLVRGLLTAAIAPKSADEMPTRIVASSHDFQQRPIDLMRRVAAMQDDALVSVIKLAWMARSVRDNLEAFDILATRAKPTIAL